MTFTINSAAALRSHLSLPRLNTCLAAGPIIKAMRGNLSGIALWLLLSSVVSGCAGGLYTDGYSAYLDANGDVVRTYPATYDKTIRAGAATLEKLGAVVLDQRFDNNEAMVNAQTPMGSSMRLHYVKEGRNLTAVRVRTGHLGYPAREYSNQFHVYLEAKLKHSAKRSANQPTPETPKPIPETSNAAGPIAAAGRQPKAKSPDKSTGQRINEPPSVKAKPTPDIDTATLPIAKHLKPDYVIFFEKDANIPSLESMRVLDEAAIRMRANPDVAVELNGYADTEEDPKGFHLVSESRSLAVKSYLIGKGIAPRRIHTDWHGSHFADIGAKDKSQDRRVEIRLNRGL